MPERFLGRTLGGRFRIDAIVGSGGFAWVYKAFDLDLEVPVALKVLKPQYAGDEKFEERFRHEASTAAKLRHPNIIKIYAVGREEDAVYFAMDFLPQGLADRLNVMTILPESMALRMGIDVASALGYAHREGVIHRDIKTDNILFDEHGNAVVADFGIARAVSNYAEQTGTNMVVGTPQYFSPEQARGLALDGRSDLYSLGVTLFKSMTGQLPFTGTDWYEIARQHVEDKPPKPRSLNPALSREFERIILRLLEKEAADRYTNGEQLAEEMMQLLQARGESLTYRTLPVPQSQVPTQSHVSLPRIRRRLARMDRKWWMAAAVLVIVILGLALRTGYEHAAPADSGAATGTAMLPPAGGAAGGVGVAATAGRARDPRVPPTPRALSVEAPATATVMLDGVQLPMQNGAWRSDSVHPGVHELSASVHTIAGCHADRVTQQATVLDTGVTEVKLQPRECGTLSIDEPARAHATIISYAGDRTIRADLPSRGPFILPEGQYRLTVEQTLCARYQNEFRIRGGRDTRVRVRLICTRP